jgi:hypothetical protein
MFINLASGELQATAEQARLLVAPAGEQAGLRRYVEKVFMVEDNRDTGSRMRNIIAGVVALAEPGRGNDLPSVRGAL